MVTAPRVMSPTQGGARLAWCDALFELVPGVRLNLNIADPLPAPQVVESDDWGAWDEATAELDALDERFR